MGVDQAQQHKLIYEGFFISVLLKGLISLAEIVVGIAVFFIPLSLISNFVDYVLRSELNEGDVLATHLSSYGAQLASASVTFIAVYLLSRGLVKLVLVWALLKNQLWAYPWSLVVLALFVAYQLYQIVVSHSLVVVALTVFDLVVMYFIWREWAVVRMRTVPQTQAPQS